MATSNGKVPVESVYRGGAGPGTAVPAWSTLG